ncbi:multidrug efflux MFS transporter [Streptococcus dysgalactiae subsp. equisimilis]|uniref:Major facilitator superfamily protein n=1 Tax=Streptococcus dysgalactiae TaxID=1334 RepID=A0A9X9QPE0_STRDY|nr:MDR family MFS transporter [Streptococcus dysgalactiae]MCL6221929.1 multidrug efflux MFS transporter [Streptococcus dysgalactiae subsp. equisimilis]UMY67982.1 multidrug efflux MFS transporter [Streptococcus dysgalactiae subsp. equisimilis]VTS47425.1 major facilitator superfamily protein [Streptococcus dysgalactiae subsp. equisimilis]VTS51062.1 major facilitator superfamily protein [Streptococcus dysgalactiae subsp. equisimilis]VTS78746.1 major facilitator superfamily protein [Streptococcus 
MNSKKTFDIHGKEYNRTAMVMLLLIATFAGVLNQTSLGTAIPTLMTSFNINLATAQQATTWFLLANGIMIPVSAYLTTRFSTKWLYVTAYAILITGLLITALAPTDNWTLFLFGRIIQASAVGITMPLMQVVMVNIFPAEQRGAAMGLNGLVVGLAPAIGPTFAGWILKHDFVLMGVHLSWRAIFILPLVILTLAFLAAPFVVKDVIANRDMSLDVPSLILSIIGFGSFLWGFTNVANNGWGDLTMVILPIVIGVSVIALFIYRQLHLEVPFLDVRVFKVKQFSVTTAAIALSMMAMMGVEMMLPLYLQNVHGLSALDSGLALLPGALMMGLVSPIAGRVYDKVGARRMALVGFSILAIGTIPFTFLTAATPDHFITLMYAVRMFGIAMVMMPLTASAMSALPPHEAAHGTAANNTARQIASAIVVALLSSVTQNVINTNKPAKLLLTNDPLAYASKMIDASLKGFQTSFSLGLVFALLGIMVALFLRKGKHIEIERDLSA